MNPIIYSWVDSDILTHNFSPRKIKVVKYFKGLLTWKEWNWSVIKLYKTLWENDLVKYHEIHNSINTRFHSFNKELKYNWEIFNSIILNILKLENNFINKKELLLLYSKNIRKYLENYLEDNEINWISIQKYIEWPTLKDLIVSTYDFDKKSIWPYVTNPFRVHWDYLDPVNVKITWANKWILEWIITDSSNHISQLLRKK